MQIDQLGLVVETFQVKLRLIARTQLVDSHLQGAGGVFGEIATLPRSLVVQAEQSRRQIDGSSKAAS